VVGHVKVLDVEAHDDVVASGCNEVLVVCVHDDYERPDVVGDVCHVQILAIGD